MKSLQLILLVFASLAAILIIFDLVLYAVISIRNYNLNRYFMQTVINFIEKLPEKMS